MERQLVDALEMVIEEHEEQQPGPVGIYEPVDIQSLIGVLSQVRSITYKEKYNKQELRIDFDGDIFGCSCSKVYIGCDEDFAHLQEDKNIPKEKLIHIQQATIIIWGIIEDRI